jgi:hypothetical protein
MACLSLVLLQVGSVVATLDNLLDSLHLSRLTLKLGLAHLCLSPEQLLVRFAVAASKAIPKRSELSVAVDLC